jgi:hypothetical protein
MGVDNNNGMIGYRVRVRVRDFLGLEELGRGLVEMSGSGLLGFVRSYRGVDISGGDVEGLDLVLGFNYFGGEGDFIFGGGLVEVEEFERYEIKDREGEIEEIWNKVLDWSVRYWGYNFWIKRRDRESVRGRHYMMYVLVSHYGLSLEEASKRSGYSGSMCYKIRAGYFGIIVDKDLRIYVDKIIKEVV